MKSLNYTTTVIAAVCLLAGLGGIFQVAAKPATYEINVSSAVAPVFPRLATLAHVDGSVHIKVEIDKAGEVVAAVAVDGHSLLRGTAINAAKLWHFAPNGDSAALRSVVLTFDFNLISDEATEAELMPIFHPPYEVEVRYFIPPHIDVDVGPNKPIKGRR